MWRAQGCGVREIACRLGRSLSTISRELRRNASTRTYRLDYKASTAQWHAERRARRPKAAKLITNERLRDYVSDRLSGPVRTTGGERLGPEGPTWDGKNKPHRQDREWVTGWSPQQIAKRLPMEFPDDFSIRISHEAIYQALYVPTRGGLVREQSWHLRRGRTKRMPRARTRQQAWAHVTEATTLKKPPSEAEDRKIAGQWGGGPHHRSQPVGDRDTDRSRDAFRDAGPPAPADRIRADQAEEERSRIGRIWCRDHEERAR